MSTDTAATVCDLDKIMGIVALSAQIVEREAGRNEDLAHAFSALGGAVALLQSLSQRISGDVKLVTRVAAQAPGAEVRP